MFSIGYDVVVDYVYDDYVYEVLYGWCCWLFVINYKDIGMLYLLFLFIMFLLGGVMVFGICVELFELGLQIMCLEFFNEFMMMYGLIMVFGVIMLVFVGFVNWMILLQIGVFDMVFVWMNNFSFWLLLVVVVLLVGLFFVLGGVMVVGWMLYVLLLMQMGLGMDFVIFVVYIMGVLLIMGGINIVVMILNMCVLGMMLMKMLMFVWMWLIIVYLLIVVMLVLVGVIMMVLFDCYFGMLFFNVVGGGDLVMYQYIFWFFGYFEVYIMILLVFGIVLQVILVFVCKMLFGYSLMVYVMVLIVILLFMVWVYYMFVMGMLVIGQLFFMYVMMLIVVLMGVKVFNWFVMMWCGLMMFEILMLFVIGFLFVFMFGGLMGLMFVMVLFDIQYYGIYFVVVYFYYVLVVGLLFVLFLGWYYWVLKWMGWMYNEMCGKIYFWVLMIFFNLMFFLMYFVGFVGMLCCYVDYLVQFMDFNQVVMIGVFGFGFVQVYFLFVVVLLVYCGGGELEKVLDKLWDGVMGFEWMVLSLVLFYMFE